MLFREREQTGHEYKIEQDPVMPQKLWLEVKGRGTNPEAYFAHLQVRIMEMFDCILDPPPKIAPPPPRSIWEWVRENPYKDVV